MNRLAKAAAALLASWALCAPAMARADENLEKKVALVKTFLENEMYDVTALAGKYSLEAWETVERVVPPRAMALIDLDSYAYLAELGIPVYSLKLANNIDAWQLAHGFRTGRWHKDFVKDFKMPEEILAYSKAAAEKDADFSKGIGWVRAHLKERISKNKHAYRRVCVEDESSCDYLEIGSNVDRINNSHLLFLIKQRMDFFEGPKGNAAIRQLFSKEIDDVETGGLFFSGKDGLEFYFVPSLDETDEESKTSYALPEIAYFVPNVGTLHTHPLAKGGKAINFSGPSGYAKAESAKSWDDYMMVDLGLLRQLEDHQRYSVETVITQMGKGKYNVDVYLRDLRVADDGSFYWPQESIVIDLGVYRYK